MRYEQTNIIEGTTHKGTNVIE